MPKYSYQSTPGERIRATTFRGTAQDFAEALAEDCPGDYGTQPDVRVWDGPITEPPAATAR